jgi:hypothetical protein
MFGFFTIRQRDIIEHGAAEARCGADRWWRARMLDYRAVTTSFTRRSKRAFPRG